MSYATDISSQPSVGSKEFTKPKVGCAGSTPKEKPGSESKLILDVLKQIVEPPAQSLPGKAEVVVHDLNQLPDSIVAVAGELTGREPGDPATDFLLEKSATGNFRTEVGYGTVLDNGLQLKSTTIIIKDSGDVPVAALCINGDMAPWMYLQEVITQILPDSQTAAVGIAAPTESFARTVEELADSIVARAVHEQGIPTKLMQKEHKIAVVRSAKSRGLFMLRGAIEMLAEELDVTRFTIYNYLSEISGEETND